MADTAAFCVDHLFPKVPVRQFVLSVPVSLRFRMGYSPDLTTAVLRCFIVAITSDSRRRARRRKIRGDLETGAMTVIQRFGSSLALNVHFHTLAVERDQVVSSTGPVEIGRSGSVEPREIDPSNLPRLSRLPWALLLKRVFLVDVLECPKCKGRTKILAAVIAPTNARRILESLGLPSEAPRLQAARPPPQLELVDGGMQSDAFYADPPSPEE